MKQQVLANRPIWGSLLLLCCLVASEAPRADRRRLSEFPACGVKLHLQYPYYVSGRGLEDVYCATSPTLEFVPDANGVPVYIGVGCCNNAGVCHRTYDNNANWDNANCFAGTYSPGANVLGNPKTWHQAVVLCDNEGRELCAAPLTTGICNNKGCNYDYLYQWSTTECEPGDANYQEECESTTTAQVVWYQGGVNMDYNGMKASCGEELCTYDQLCPGGEPYTSPVGGQQADHDMWAPILPGPGEGTQNWVQVGTRASGGVALHTAGLNFYSYPHRTAACAGSTPTMLVRPTLTMAGGARPAHGYGRAVSPAATRLFLLPSRRSRATS